MTVVQFPKREAGLSEEHAGLIGCLGRVIASVQVCPSERNNPSVVLPPIVTIVKRLAKSAGGSGPRKPSAFLVWTVLRSSLRVKPLSNV